LKKEIAFIPSPLEGRLFFCYLKTLAPSPPTPSPLREGEF